MPLYLVVLSVPLPSTAAESPHVVRHLVDAPSKAAAEKHVAKKYIGEAEVPSPRTLADIAGGGVKVETAGEAS